MIKATTIPINRTAQSRLSDRSLDAASFGRVFSDHMLAADYVRDEWTDVRIEPYGPLPMSPATSALQYGVSVFDGHKAFRTADDRIVLFRPHENCERLQRSCRRLALPVVPESIYLDGLKELIRLDREWVPGPEEGSLYIRSTVFATDENIRVRPPAAAKFLILTCPVGQYYAEPLKLLATTDYVRAFPGGTGDVKPAGNYGPTLIVERDAQAHGYHGVLWLDGLEHRFIEEAGVMNVFFVIDGRVVTPNLGGTILPGVTRDSVLKLLMHEMDIGVEERPISIDEVLQARGSGQLQECFGTGTAATISHIAEIRYGGESITFPPVTDRRIGPAVQARLQAISTSQAPDRFGWLVAV